MGHPLDQFLGGVCDDHCTILLLNFGMLLHQKVRRITLVAKQPYVFDG
tara:strand:- start:51 stop:194 length:144 start_codon:yes stop_codon:yes gene_type:complete